MAGDEVTAHHCHFLGCRNPCPPKHLGCGDCWAKVPRDIQDEVYRTVVLRGKYVDETWAPWWRAQARAIAHVAHLREPNEARRDAWIAKADKFAAMLEARAKKEGKP